MTAKNADLKSRILQEGEYSKPELFIQNDLPSGYPVIHYAVAFFYRYGSSNPEFVEDDVNIPPGGGEPVYGDRRDCCWRIRVIVVVRTPSGSTLEGAGEFDADAGECTVREVIALTANESAFGVKPGLTIRVTKRSY